MRRFVKSLCLIFVLCISVSAFACDIGVGRPTPTDDKYFEIALVGDTYELSAKSGIELPSQIILPTEIDGKQITKIADFAFANTTVIKVAIPEGYTVIGAYAFDRCHSLMTVEISDTVTDIEQGAFSGCTAYVNTLYIPDSVATIGNNCFELCTSLSVVSVPKNCTLGTDLTSGCPNLVIDVRNK